MKFLLPFICLWFLPCFITAQNPHTIDSLQKIIKTNPSNQQKVDAYNLIAREYRYADSVQVAHYTTQAMVLAKKVNYEAGIADAWDHLGWITLTRGHYIQATEFFYHTLQTAQKVNYKKGIANGYNGLGKTWYYQGNYAKSLEFFLQSLKIREEIKDKGGIAFTCNDMGIVYYEYSNYPKALKFFHRSLKLKEEIGNRRGMGWDYDYMGNVYYNQGNYPRALEMYRKALKIRVEISDKSGIAYSYLGLGKFALSQKKYDQAKSYFEQALALRQELGETALSAEVWVSLGIAYYIQKNYTKAQVHLENGIQSALTIGYYATARDGAEYLSKTYQAMNKPQQALENHILFKRMADSLLNEKNIRQITRLEEQFGAQKREDSLHLAQAKKNVQHRADIREREAKQKLTLVGLGVSSALALVLLFFYRSKRRSNHQLNEANEEIKTINDSLERKNEDITSSITYAQRIQQAILPLDEDMRKCLPEHFVLFRPRDIVSGDFYWYDKTDNKVFVAVADCTGHGVPGAFMTILGAQALGNIIMQNPDCTPDKVLLKLDEVLRKTLKSENTSVRDGMDITIVAIDKTKRELQYAGAKNPLVVVQNNQVLEIKGNMHSINEFQRKGKEEAHFTTHRLDISSPATIYLYSDGYQDQFGGKEGKKFMKKRFRELLFEISDQPMEEQCKLLEVILDGWMNGREQVDDILVMGVQL